MPLLSPPLCKRQFYRIRSAHPKVGTVTARIGVDMKNYGRNSKIVASYSTLAVVAVGIIALDFVHRSKSGDAIPDFPDPLLASQSPPTVPSASWNTDTSTETEATVSNRKSKSAAPRRVTVATYSALRPAK
jgi:hypothetical protein